MHYDFTDDIRLTFLLARSQAVGMRQECVRTEHLLLAILQRPTAVVARVLSHFNVDPADLTAAIEQRFGPPAGAAVPEDPPLPYAPDAKKAIEVAMAEAQWNHVDQDHLLLGILSAPVDEAADMLRERGIDVEAARRLLMQVNEPRG
jgi:ATP-dependent Clp protease ATP-binding subunit ClpA